MLEAWGITNTDIGTAFSAYGFSAMISYILGGSFADRYQPRILMAISLATTALAGLSLIFAPSKTTLIVTYFFFGISTIFLMWGALIKVTHQSGGDDKRATAMGILDSGRGAAAAVVSSLLVFVIGILFTEKELETQSIEAVKIIYAITIGIILSTSFFIWRALKNFKPQGENKIESWSKEKAKILLTDSKIWLLGIIVLSAYCGYKNIDIYSVYLTDVLSYSKEDSAEYTSIILWLRPIATLIAGIFTDWFHHRKKQGRFTVLTFLLFLCTTFQYLFAFQVTSTETLILVIILLSATFAYALRSVYFSILGDLNIKNHLVGTAVGIVSFVGYLPDMFHGFLTGRLIDSNPGVLGFQYSFGVTASFLLIGTIASYFLTKKAN